MEARPCRGQLYGTYRPRIQLSGDPGGLARVVPRLCPHPARAPSRTDRVVVQGLATRAEAVVPAAVNREPGFRGPIGPSVHSPG